MMTMLRLELFKIKRRKLFLPIIGLFIFGLFWTKVVLVQAFSNNPLTKSIEFVITTLVIVNGLIMPLIVGLFASKICEVEHTGKTFNLLATCNQSRKQLFIAKFIFQTILVAILMIGQLIFLLMTVQQNGLDLNLKSIVAFFLGMIFAGTIVSVLHLYLSLIIEKQTIGIVLALIGAFVGMVTAGMLPKMVQLFIPWQYFGLLNPIKQNTETTIYTFDSMWFLYFGISCVVLVISLFFTTKRINKIGKGGAQ